MKILFVSDYTLAQREGGAQRSNSLLIKKGKELGHEIVEHNYESSITDFLASYDLIIHSNLEHINSINPEKIDFLKRLPNCIRLEHDSCHYLDTRARAHLFTTSIKNFFLSDFHLSFFKELYGDYFINTEIVYDPIDTELFCKTDQEKIYDVVYCGFIHELKGAEKIINFARKNPEKQISIFGWSHRNPYELFENEKNIHFGGLKTQEEVASILKQSKAIFHSPIVNEPFCRMVAEALLCGVEEVIGEVDKIGSYLEFQKVGYDEFKNKCGNAAENFWEKVEK